MQFLIILVILSLVVMIVTSPLRRQNQGEDQSKQRADEPQGKLADLEAAREAKYREIRDAELDHRTGKLSDEDFEAVDGVLRAEAVEIMHRLDRAGGSGLRGENGVGPDGRLTSG